MDYAIETQGLCRTFGTQRAVDRLDLHVAAGQVYGFLGKNGAGKTTTIRLLLGLIRRNAGTVLYSGQELDRDRAGILSRVGSLIEYPGFYENLSARENLHLYEVLRGVQKKGAIDRVLETVSLKGTGTKAVKHFSLGMKQRLGLARALLHDPDILILDEPTNGLDPEGIREIRTLIQSLARDWGKTIVISSHLLSEVEQIAQTIGIVHHGRMLEEIGSEELNRRNRRYVLCRVSDPAKAAFLLENRMKVTDFSIHSEGEIRIYEGLDRSPQYNRTLVEAGVDVEVLQLSQGNLEEYFLHLTQEEV